MNKTAIKNFAVWARRKLISDITYKAGMLGITDSGIAEPLPISTKDLQFFDIGTKDYAEVSGNEISQRKALVDAIKRKEKTSKTYKEAFEYIVEEVAYTWFNRLIAIRFMEVNDYLPSGIRVLSSENPAKNEPDFVTTPFDTDLEFTPFEQDKVVQLKDENKLDELFRMLFIKECNKLHEILPELFEKTDDYTELLLTISFTDKDGVVFHLVHDIEERDFNVAEEGQVEIIGWMYQYYNAEPKDVLINAHKTYKNHDVPFVTQIFTSSWIVKYMVQNTLGRIWIEGHPNDTLKERWEFYLDESEQTDDIQIQLNEIKNEYKNITPEEIKVIDPCMGSGHILVYAFDVLMQIYESYGYTQRDAARSILINNIHGLDIDTRAYQLAYFAVMMKARQYNRRILTEGIAPNLFAIKESNEISIDLIKFIANGDSNIEKDLTTVCDELYDATEYGSILNITNVNFEQLYNRIEEIKDSFYDDIFGQGYQMETNSVVLSLIKQAHTMAQKYDVVVTNPPYMNSSYMPKKLKDFIQKNYLDYKADIFAAFVCKAINICKINGQIGFITPYVWMFIASYDKLRKKVYNDTSITSLVQLEYNAFEGACVPVCTFTLRKSNIKSSGEYIKLSEFKGSENQGPKTREAILNPNCGYRFTTHQSQYDLIPGSPLAYWINQDFLNVFSNPSIGNHGETSKGIITGDNASFLRLWFETRNTDINFVAKNWNDSEISNLKWYPCNKGGDFRRWYGNNIYVIDWWHNGHRIMQKGMDKVRNCQDYSDENKFKPSITWTSLSSSKSSFRYSCNALSESAGMTFFPSEKYIDYSLAFLNSKVANYILNMLNPTLNYTAGSIGSLPLKISECKQEDIKKKAQCCLTVSHQDWDSFETSWDFAKHPLLCFAPHNSMPEVPMNYTIASAFDAWNTVCEDRFNKLKANEEELNRIFIEIYGLQDELTPEVEDKDVTVRKADLQREIKSLISYAIGCMLGRYSLDIEGLSFAGGEWDNTQYSTFIPDADNCLPITDEEYFEDDVVGRFVKFIETVYGELTLEENLDFIAKALGNKGNTSREVIRNYFLNDFIKDHIKIYQKRPIYWLYDSGKQNGFKALAYMHRYNADTTGNMRVEYLHRMQRVYEKELERMQDTIDNSRDNKEISSATKRKEKLQKQLKETKEYDAKVAHLALSRIGIDLDDGVKVNYEKVQTASDGTKLDILAKI